MKIILNLFLILAFPTQTSFQFIDAATELNKVESGEMQGHELAFDYQWVIFLDTGFYETLSRIEDFDTDFNPQLVVNSLQKSYHKTIRFKGEYSDIRDVINKSESLHGYINPDGYEIDKPIPVAGSKALLSIGNLEYQAYYLVEILQTSEIDVVQVGSVHAQVIPQSMLDEMSKIEENKKTKKKKKKN